MTQRRRAPWLGRFARGLIADVLLHVVIATAAGVTLFLVVDFVELTNRASARATSADYALLLLLKIPRVLKLLLPVSAPIGTLTACGARMRRLEVAAMFAAGASPAALAKPVIIAGLIAAASYSAAVEILVPPTAGRSHEVRRRMGLPGELPPGRNSWFKGSDRLYRVQSLDDPDGSQLRDVLVLELEAGQLVRRWDMATLSHQEGGWVGSDVVRRDLRPDDGAGMRTVHAASAPLALQEQPADFVTNIAAPSRLSYRVLARTTEARERLGRPALEHRIELYRRHATPAIVLLAMLVAGSVAMMLGRRQTLAGALGAGAAIGFSAWILQELFRLVGAAGALSAEVSTHAVVALLTVAATMGWARVVRRGVAET